MFADIFLQILHSGERRPTPARLRDFAAGDWAIFIAEAIEYRLSSQVAQYFRTDPVKLALVPRQFLEQLNDSVRLTVVTNLVQQDRLKQMLLECGKRDIPVMVVKGLWLVEHVYRDLGGRSCGDIDLIVRPANMPAFTELVKELGFEVPADVTNISELASTNNEFALRHRTDGTFFDVHWFLMHPSEDRPIDEEALWARSETVHLAGVACGTLRLEDHILYICFHAAMHHRFRFVGPRALLDLAKLIEQPPRAIDWQDLVRRAHALGWQRGAWLMFDLVREHLGVTPPEEVLMALQPAEDKETARVREVAIELLCEAQQRQELPRNLVRLMDQPLRGKFALLERQLFPARRKLAGQFLVNGTAAGWTWLYIRRWRDLAMTSVPQLFRFALGKGAYLDLQRSRLIERWVSNRR